MKVTLRTMLTTVLLLSSLTVTFGQHTMFLTKPTGVTYLDDIINGDTTSTGDRKDMQRIYELQRGGTWFWHGTIVNNGWKLDIEAADTGSTQKPKIYTTEALGTTAAPYQWVDVQGDVTVKNCILSGYFDPDTSAFNTYGGSFILFRCATPGPRMEFEGNVFSNIGQAVASAFAAVPTIIFKDNIFANMGLPPLVDVGNGRVVDIRNVSVDSLVLINNTLAYGFDRVVRHISSVGRLNHFIFDHNTVYENGGRYGTIALGAVGASVQITNNLLVDPMAFGSDTASDRHWDFTELNEFDSNGHIKMAWIYNSPAASDTLPGQAATNWKISDNYYYITPQIQAVYDTCQKEGWMPNIWAGRPITDSIKAKVDTTTAFYKLNNFSFTNVPAPITAPVLWATKPISLGGTGSGSSGGTYPGYDKHLTTFYADTMDCSYSTSSAAYTGANSGFPVGDLNWFPDKKAEWMLTGVEETTPGYAPTKFSLEQNYPNPFNPSTMIKFSIPQSNRVSLVVYNLLGQKVATLIDNEMNAGEHQVNFNAANLSSGIYFYSITSGSFNMTKKMMLLK